MPQDVTKLEAQLREAHLQGDEQTAKQVAQEIRQVMASQQGGLPPVGSLAVLLNTPPRPGSQLPTPTGAQFPELEAQLMQAHQTGDAQSAARFASQIRDAQEVAQSLELSDRSFTAQDASALQQLKTAAGFFLNASPEARKDILRQQLGDAVIFEKDEEGRDIVIFGNERAFLNKPGMDANDVVQFLGDIVKFLPAGRAASIAGASGRATVRRSLTSEPVVRRSLTGAAAAGGTVSAVTEGASQAASGAFGSGQGIDPVQTGVVAAGGAGGEVVGSALRGVARLVPGLNLTPTARQFERRVADRGIELNAQPGRQVEQLQSAAGRLSAPRDEALPQVAASVSAAREQERRVGGALFDAARQTRALVPAENVQELSARVGHALADFDLGADEMKTLSRLTGQLRSLADPDIPFDRKLNALETWRRRVRAMSVKDGSPREAASKRTLQAYDRWLDDALNRDLIRGDENAVQAWRTAREFWASYKSRFDANKVVRSLARQEATPEEMSRWIFNMNAVGAKAQAGTVLENLGRVLGPDSKEMGLLRGVVITDLAEPLFRDVPDAAGFANNYVKWLRNNPTTAKQLFPGETGEQLREIAMLARSIGQRPGAQPRDLAPQDISGRVISLLTRVFVGHGIARGGARVQVGTTFANFLRRVTSGSSARIKILHEQLGADPTRPLFTRSATPAGAATANQQEDQ